MAAKKTSKKVKKTQRAAAKKAVVEKRAPKKPASKKTAAKKTAAKKKGSTAPKKAIRAKQPARKKPSRKSKQQQTATIHRDELESRSGLESGDLQGIRDVESADSESVDELLEEGNAFEAGIVAGVERAQGEDGAEVKTHEVPEDDVPEEYLNPDRD